MNNTQTKLRKHQFFDISYQDRRKIGLSNKKTLQDIIYFIIVAAVPSSFFALVNEQVFYIEGYFDIRLLNWILTLPFFFFFLKNIKYMRHVSGMKLLLIVIFYIILVFVATLLKGITFSETFKVFRMDYFTPISCLGLLLYLISMGLHRIHRFFNWIILAMTLQGFFYIVDLTTGASIFSASVYLEEDWYGGVIKRYNLAYPLFNTWIFIFSLINLTFNRKKIWLVPLIISSFTMLLSGYRFAFFQFIFLIILILILSLRVTNINKIFKLFNMIFIFSLSILLFSLLFSNYFEYFFNRINEIIVDGNLNPIYAYNYLFRIELINEVIQNGIDTGTLFLGNGYVRHSYAGAYDLALGGDTNVAPVIWTEGIIGLIIRMLPILSILLNNLKEYFMLKNSKSIAINIISISVIFSELFNFIQTTIFRNYNMVVFFLFALEITKYKYNQYQMSTNKII